MLQSSKSSYASNNCAIFFHLTSSFNTETTKRLGLPKTTDMILLTIVKTESTEKYRCQ